MMAKVFFLAIVWIAILNAGNAQNVTEDEAALQNVTENEVLIQSGPSNSKCQKPYRKGDISDQEIDDYFRQCRDLASEREKLEKDLVSEGKIYKPDGRTTDLSRIRNSKNDPGVRQHELKELAFDCVTNKLIQKYCISDEDLKNDLPQLRPKGKYCEEARDTCQSDLFRGNCDSRAKYRTANGVCNNLRNPRWGSNGICFRRLLPARYVGTSGFRQSVLGGDLPNARDLSLNIHSHMNRPTNYITHMFMFFGQLLDHDITQTPFSVTTDNQPIECCGQTGQLHPQCAPIQIRSNDPFYSQLGTTCMNFPRSSICPMCALGQRQQMNQITAFIDASFIYGNNLDETNDLRANDGTGRLRVNRTSRGDLLPSSPNPRSDLCSFVNTSDICFLSGDARTNQHTTLASLHTVFVREHNRLADELRRVNPRWNDETLFQEARRIVGAEMQVITYKEFLPSTLGKERMDFFSLWLSDYSTQYDSYLDPTIYTEFSTAAFRFGHSLINSLVAQSPRSQNGGNRLLRNEFFQPFELRNGIIGPLLQGVSRTSAQWFDRYLVQDVTNFLYRIRGAPAGLDLAAINIQRGRDHGIPSYAQMIEFCSDNKFKIQRFGDLSDYDIMSEENIRLLSRNYRHVRDVDLWTGILSEKYNQDSVIGPTAICIVGLQFNRLKFGDRFYFEHRNQAGSFSYQQVQELKKVTLSKIICLNTDATQLPLNAMLFPNKNNPNINCNYVRGVDLSYWRA